MKSLRVRALVLCLCVSPLAIQAQTWVGGSGGNVFSVAANWSSNPSVPGTNASLTFNTTTNTNVGFNNLPYTANSLTFASAATNQFFINGNGGTLTINSGVTTQSGSGGANFASAVNIAFGGNQTWSTASTVSVAGSVTDGASSYSLTKTGSGNLILSGSNSYDGGTTISAGGLYLGSTNTITGNFSIGATGKLGTAFGDVTLGNAITMTSGATLGGSTQGSASMELNGNVTLDTTSHTLNLGSKSDVFFGGAIAPGSGTTALTVAGDGTSIAILGGSMSNVTSVTANNAAVAFGKSGTLPTTQIHATGGGYVSIADIDGGVSTPSVSAFMGLITNKAGFNGVLGFDTTEDAGSPHNYTDDIDLTGFTNGQVRLGSLTSAILSGTITPVGSTYDFGGFAAQDGLLVVKSDLVGARSVSVVTPSASGGAPQNGMVLITQGTGNTFSGNINLTYSSVIVDSAISGTTNINAGAYSYAGFTENAGLTFAQFAARVAAGGYTNTSILGIDSKDIIAEYVDGASFSAFHSQGAIDLSGFTGIYLGTMTGATITGAITAAGDGVLRVMNNSSDAPFTLQAAITSGNGVTNGLVLGMDGTEGGITLGSNNTFGGNTTLLGGGLLVANGTTSALSGGSLTVTAPTAGDQSFIGADSGSASLANNITVTGTTLKVGTGGVDEDSSDQRYHAGSSSLTLSGVISGTGGLEIAGTTILSGANTYTGGTTIRGDTTVSSNAGLGTGVVFIGYKDTDNDGNPLNGSTPDKSTLNFTGSAHSIGFLTDASLFTFNGGTGNINFTAATPTLTINQANGPSSVGTFSGQFTGNAVALVKNGANQLALTGANAGQISSITVNAGSVTIGDANATGATFSGNVTVAGGGFLFRPGAGDTISYGGNISGTAGFVTINGQSSGVTYITGGSNTFTVNTTINGGTLRIGGDNLWSSASATTVNTNTTLQLDGNQTIKNLSGTGTVNIVTGGKTLTVNSAAGSTFDGVITGSGGLTKTGAATTFTLTANNTYTGSTLVSAGTLMVNGSLASSSVTVANGAFLMGTGTLNDVTLNSGGTYRPGLSSAAAVGSPGTELEFAL